MNGKSKIKIVFNHSYQSPVRGGGRSEFWAVFINRAVQERESRNRSFDERNYEITETLLEGRVRNHFGRNLKKYLSEISASNIKYDNESLLQLSNSVVFAVEDVSYGSLDISLIAEPIEKVTKFFENNFDYLDTFLRTYALPALADSLHYGSGGSYYVDYRYIVDQLNVDIIPDASLIKNFETKQDNTSHLQSNSRPLTNRANWLWIVSNTSLIVPVVIACVIMYFAFGRLQEREKDIDSKNKELYQHQKELINSLMTNRPFNLPKDSTK